MILACSVSVKKDRGALKIKGRRRREMIRDYGAAGSWTNSSMSYSRTVLATNPDKDWVRSIRH
jgi:hypothetical protein